MSFANLLILANFIALLVVTFFLWSAIKSTKRQVMSQLNRELAEVRRQMRTSMKSVDRLYDHVTDNHERILKIEVNLVNTQDELEYISGKITDMQNFADARAPKQEQVPDDERKHIYD